MPPRSYASQGRRTRVPSSNRDQENLPLMLFSSIIYGRQEAKRWDTTDMPPRITRKSYRLRASDRTMVGIFCNRTACRIRNRRRRHDSNMNRRKKRTPRASLHYIGWRAWQKSLLLPVAGEIFLLTLPFIERRYRPCGFKFPITRVISMGRRNTKVEPTLH